MQPDAYLIGTSRGAIVDESALIDVLRDRRIAGAGLDVFDRETLAAFYGDMPEAITAFAAGSPIRVINKDAL